MFDTFQGLPVHALIVHATVVILPLAAFMVGLAAVYPRFRLWAGPLPAVLAVISVVLVPLSTMSGDKLYARMLKFGHNPLIEDHKHLAGLLKFIVVPFAIFAVAGYLLERRGNAAKGLLVTVSVLSVVAAGALAVDVALIGHAGAKANWDPIVQSTNH